MPSLPPVLRWWVMLCVVSLLGFQSLGMVHRTLHGGIAAPLAVLAVAGTGSGVGTAPAINVGNEAGAPAHRADGTPRTHRATAANPDGGADLATPAPVAATFKSPSLSHMPGSSDCQLLDQLSTALGPVSQALAWISLLPDHPVSTPQPHSASVAQTWRTPARAPPAA